MRFGLGVPPSIVDVPQQIHICVVVALAPYADTRAATGRCCIEKEQRCSNLCFPDACDVVFEELSALQVLINNRVWSHLPVSKASSGGRKRLLLY